MRRVLPPITVCALLLLAGCATAPGGAGAGESSVSPTAEPSSSEAPSPTPAVTPTPDVGVPASDLETLVSACLEEARTLGPGPAAQIEGSTIRWDDARSALRPDGLWYAVVPLDDPATGSAIEYQCLATDDLEFSLHAGRLAPEVDDFEQWATGTEVQEGV